jgi:hypothetical protein
LSYRVFAFIAIPSGRKFDMARFLITFLVLLGVFFGAQLTPWGQDYFVTVLR